MEIASHIKENLGDRWLPVIYRDKIRTLRTRAYRLEVEMRENKTEIQHTLLGVELKVRNKRLSCPDLSTARYLQVFARLGCQEIAVPYDITKISHLADELESSWQRTLLLAEHTSAGRVKGFRTRLRKALTAEIRSEIAEAGAGAAVPVFKQTTRQRRSA